MNYAIKVEQIEGGDFLAQVDWSKGDAGQVGTPGACKYGETSTEAFDKLSALLQARGHTVINTVAESLAERQICYSDRVTPCDCPGLCRDKM